MLMFMVSGVLAFGGNNINKIEFLNDKLAVDVEKESLSSVLSKIHKKTGIQFALDKREFDSIISVRFQSLPIEKAIARILNKLNYAVIFGPEGKVRKVTIYGKNRITLVSHVHKGNTSSSSNTMLSKSASGEGMNITHPKYYMVIEPPGKEGMKITYPPHKMVIEPASKEGMKITHPSTEMVIDLPNKEGMKIKYPSNPNIP